MSKKPAGPRRSRTIAVSEFKAKCLALIEEINLKGEELLVTKRGRPIARVLPAREKAPPSLLGSVTFEQDLISPTGEAWLAES